jgi:hypothetical protein
MDSNVIIAIAGISGTLLAGLGTTVLNHFLSERRAKAEVRQVYKERRISPLIELMSDVANLTRRLHISKDETEMRSIIDELEVIVEDRMWTAATSALGFDERLNEEIKSVLALTQDLLGAKRKVLDSQDSHDNKRCGMITGELMTEAGLAIHLCYEILEKR